MTETFSRLLRAFGDSVGIPDLDMDANGACCIGYDETLVVLCFDVRTGTVHAYCHLGWLPEGDADPLVRRLLRLNANKVGSFPVWAAVDGDGSEILLMAKACAAAMREDAFANFLDTVAATTARWAEIVAGHAPESPAVTGEEAVSGLPDFA